MTSRSCALQHVNDVVGQDRLGEGGEAANVREHDGDGKLVTDRSGAPGATSSTVRRSAPVLSVPSRSRRPPPDVGELHVALVEDEAADRQVASRHGLAGEAKLWTEPQLVGDGPLPGVAIAERLPSLDDHDAARRAFALAPAGMGEGDPGA